jgi:hypothetical protein
MPRPIIDSPLMRRKNTSSVHREVADPMIGDQRGLTGMDAAIIRHRLRRSLTRVPDDADAARARLIALDEALQCE